MNYSELQTNIASWLNREDLTAIIPTFVDLCEADLNRSLRCREMICRATATLDSQFISLPNDFLEIRNIQLNSSPPRGLEFVTLDYADQMRGSEHYSSGQPKYFTVHDGTIEVIPSPDAEYTIELSYYQKVASLTSSVTTNWVLNSHPDIYLYGSLMHSAPFLKEDERFVLWGGRYRQFVADLNAQSTASEYSKGGLQMRNRTWA